MSFRAFFDCDPKKNKVIFGGESECFECQPKPAPTQYPYCTIHATPTKDIHNIIWAKEFLFRSLFGATIEDDEEDETAAAARQQKLPKGEAGFGLFSSLF